MKGLVSTLCKKPRNSNCIFYMSKFLLGPQAFEDNPEVTPIGIEVNDMKI